MNIHEYQAKAMLRKFGVPVPEGEAAWSPAEARQVAEKLGSDRFVVKAQIHAGGRGKAGGVKIAGSSEEVEEIASELLGEELVTHQTGPRGRIVRKVLIEQGLDIERELYLGLLVDRSSETLALVCSTEGGMDIEEVARTSPERIHRIGIDPLLGLQAFQAREMGFRLGLKGDLLKSFAQLCSAVFAGFMVFDASLIEINPLIVTGGGKLFALDAKVNFDDNALYKHPDLNKLSDPDEEDTLETEAVEHDLNYIRLDGEVGCMVNGAGLAMATMDLIKLAGKEPANFLDVGGGASVERVAAAFRILTSDPNVKAVFVNIFGGIVRCDRVAGGIIEAARRIGIRVPMVVRLEGTNRQEATEMLRASGLKMKVAEGSLAQAVQLVVDTL